MTARIWTLSAILAATLPAACAGSNKPGFDDPEWYKARRVELKDAAYPDLKAIPAVQPGERPAQEWNVIREELRAEGQAVLAHARNAPADVSDVADFEAKQRARALPEAVPPAASPAAPPAQ